MLNIKDVVDLARAGYKPADVKELIELSKTPEPLQSETQPAQDVTLTEEQKITSISQSKTFEEPDKTPETVSKENTQPDVEPDYKALYEAEKAKVNDLQIKNTQADVSAPQTTEKDLLDLVKSFC